MMCPRCIDALLVERPLEAIAVDVCPRCQGIWLDRGELQRLRAREDQRDAEFAATEPPPVDMNRGAWRRDDDDDDDYDDDDRRRRLRPDDPAAGRRPPPSRWRALLDLFD